MSGLIITDPPRAHAEDVDALAGHGVATVHEGMGRRGSLGPGFRPIQQDVRVAGTAITALCRPGDNLLIHAAVEQCAPGDILVVATAAPSTGGMGGDLCATALEHRGVRGLVIDAGVRDTADLRAMGFPVWSTAVCARGTVKATAGSVNVPVVLGGQIVRPGDVVVADDDGVVCVPRGQAGAAVRAAEARAAKEDATRTAFAGGQLGLDHYGLRETLAQLGVRYRSYEECAPDVRDGTAS
ncbi:4-carboxy-4-hydroxy-2-oxoadipate aldolase/oxaloacetate decarboxylase [Streptomyces sp. LN325]|uniref:4-carboxy-4-hydroxy-2-oxoadipate aldolase/oxaloacetate decarboxylase n=1 Tax=Streptomyces sp. LN325 TaxID=3112976 RepID=UPI003719E718